MTCRMAHRQRQCRKKFLLFLAILTSTCLVRGKIIAFMRKWGLTFVPSVTLWASIFPSGHPMHVPFLSSVTLTTGTGMPHQCIYGITTWVYGNVLYRECQ